MKNYTDNEKPEWVSVAYSAERSIEDELARTSESDVSTIAISYCIMFAYIAIALGEARSFSRLLVCQTWIWMKYFAKFDLIWFDLIWFDFSFEYCAHRLIVKSLWVLAEFASFSYQLSRQSGSTDIWEYPLHWLLLRYLVFGNDLFIL